MRLFVVERINELFVGDITLLRTLRLMVILTDKTAGVFMSGEMKP